VLGFVGLACHGYVCAIVLLAMALSGVRLGVYGGCVASTAKFFIDVKPTLLMQPTPTSHVFRRCSFRFYSPKGCVERVIYRKCCRLTRLSRALAKKRRNGKSREYLSMSLPVRDVLPYRPCPDSRAAKGTQIPYRYEEYPIVVRYCPHKTIKVCR
jgi:hypothetical protein